MIIEEIDSNTYLSNENIRDIVEVGMGSTYADSVRSLKEEESVILVAIVDDMYVGFACGYNHQNPEEYIDYLEKDYGANSLLEKVSVLPEYRGEGIATALYKERLKKLTQPTIADAWVRTESVDSTVLLESFGFEIIGRDENRWLEESLEAEDSNFCPDCGEICKCDAIAYIYRDKYE